MVIHDESVFCKPPKYALESGEKFSEWSLKRNKEIAEHWEGFSDQERAKQYGYCWDAGTVQNEILKVCYYLFRTYPTGRFTSTDVFGQLVDRFGWEKNRDQSRTTACHALHILSILGMLKLIPLNNGPRPNYEYSFTPTVLEKGIIWLMSHNTFFPCEEMKGKVSLGFVTIDDLLRY